MLQSRLLKAEFSPANRIGMYYFDPHEKKWWRLTAIKNNHFLLENENSGKRWTTGPLDAKYFSDQPFDVIQMYNSYNPL